MVIELSGVQFGLKRVITKSHDREAGVRFVNCNHKFDFSPKLHDTKFNFHFIIFILKSLNIFVLNRKRFCLQKTHLRYLPA